jgi:hypothetical protein
MTFVRAKGMPRLLSIKETTYELGAFVPSHGAHPSPPTPGVLAAPQYKADDQ